MRKYENIAIEKLIPYENNARTHSQEQIEKIARSMQEFGFINPVLVDSKLNIIAGHGRILGAKQLGMTEVPCLFIEDLTEEQKRAYILADNRLAEDAGWDKELLRVELDELRKLNFDITITGFELDDIAIDDDFTIIEDDYEIDTEKEPTSKLGELYKLGNHYLMCGDSTDKADVKKLIGDTEIDLVVTDPPYNVNYGEKATYINKYGYDFSEKSIKNDNMTDADFLEFLTKAFNNMRQILKPGGVFYIWHASGTVLEFETALRNNNMKSRQHLIWNKNTFVLSRQDYHWKHEECLYGWKEGEGHYFVDDRTQSTVFEDDVDLDKMNKDELKNLLKDLLEDKVSTTVMNENKPTVSEEHPTMKPIKLIARHIRNSSKINEKVCDLFGGSGTTLIACEQLNRQCYMMEFDPKYIDVIINRWEKMTGEKAEKISN